jgi:hypothetical protein
MSETTVDPATQTPPPAPENQSGESTINEDTGTPPSTGTKATSDLTPPGKRRKQTSSDLPGTIPGRT